LRTAYNEFTITVPEELLGTDYLNSLLLNVTAESSTLLLPLILLSSQIGPRLMFTTAMLDHEIVRVGFLINDLVSGELVLEGFAFASQVYIAFLSEVGTWINFTLSSSTGIYEFEISPSFFQPGPHEAYAIAIGQAVPDVEMNFATLIVVHDFTVLTVGAAALIVGCVVMVIMRRQRGDMV